MISNNVTILDVLSGVSPDYSIVAQKKCSENVSSEFDEVFNKDYGLTLTDIAGNLQQTLQSKTNEFNTVSQNYNAVVSSTSWKTTKPLRIMGKFARWFLRGSAAWLTFAPGNRPRRAAKKRLIQIKGEIKKHPKIEYFARKLLSHFPNIENRLKSLPSNIPLSYQINGQEALSPRSKKSTAV